MANSFLVRRIHSISGLLPIGIFLIEHLLVNSFALRGAGAFNAAAEVMMSLPFLPFLELGIIVIPIIFHAFYGLYIVYLAKNNVLQYKYYRNWMFYLQRVTAVTTLIFVLVHTWETRIAAVFFGEHISFDMMTEILSSPFAMAFYVIGLLSAVFHFANGLWAFLITWGVTVGPNAQRVSSVIAGIIFVALSALGISALFAFVI